ncbi:MAG: 1-acylglycerol-3-phosphate O-acyltransferase [Acidobacteria bacterium]|nr:1-acylglycerol-3-phosphate O-acyltransferase [Acidobacteriota bacterium]
MRAYLLVYPLMALYVLVGAVVFVPLTWLTRDIRILYWISRQGCRLALALAGVKVRQIGLEHATANPTALFVANHVSNLDPPALFAVLPRIAVILKQELRRIPLLGYVMELGSFIYVDRRSRTSRKHAMEKAVQTLRDGVSLLVFPEGTRSPDGNLLPFRPGPFAMAMEAERPIVPITVHGARELMPKGTLRIHPGEMALLFHPPVPTIGLDPSERSALMERVRAEMQQALDSPLPPP